MSLLTTPHFTVSDVSIGRDDGVKVASVAIHPRLTSLLGERTVVRQVEFADVTASQSGLPRLMALVAPRDTDRRGEVGLSPKKTLSGKVYAQLQAVGAAAEVPLNVSGTLDAPVIAPTAASVAGAAVGAAVLGPVLGTSVGAQIGDVADKLFGSADERK